MHPCRLGQSCETCKRVPVRKRGKAAKEARNDQPNDDGTEWQGPAVEVAERQGATFEAVAEKQGEAAEKRQGATFEVAEEKQGATFEAVEKKQGATFEAAEEKQGATFEAAERQGLPSGVECHLFMCRHEGCGRCYPTKKGRAQHGEAYTPHVCK